MKSAAPIAICLFLLSSISAFSSQWLSRDAEREFKWFNSLGFPEVKGKPLVKINGGELVYDGNLRNTNKHYVTGFLLEKDQTKVSLLSLNLSLWVWTNSPTTNPELSRVEILPLDLQKQITTNLVEAWAYHGMDGHFLQNYRNFQLVDLPDRSRLFVLAWALAQNRQTPGAETLFRICKSFFATPQKFHHKSFHELLSSDLAEVALWKAILEFIDPSIDRPTLLDHLQTIAKNYPRTRLAADAQDMVSRLNKMIREDERHQKLSASSSTHPLSLDDQIHELIFQLRDQTALQRGQPARCDIFWTIDHSTNSPAHQLLAIGRLAVPQLIAALDDKSLSRCVAFQRNFFFSHHVLSVGNCSLQILEKIAGQRFFVRTNATYIITHEQIQSAKKAALAWYQSAQ